MLGGGNQVTEPGQGLGDFYRLGLALVTSLQTNLPAQAGAARNSHPGPAHSAACPYPLLWDCNTWSCPPATSQAHTGLGRPGPGHLSLGTQLLSPPPKPLRAVHPHTLPPDSPSPPNLVPAPALTQGIPTSAPPGKSCTATPAHLPPMSHVHSPYHNPKSLHSQLGFSTTVPSSPQHSPHGHSRCPCPSPAHPPPSRR